MRHLQESRDALWMLRDHRTVENIIGKQQCLGMFAQLIQDPFRTRLRRLPHKQSVNFQAAANRFLNQVDSFDGTEALDRSRLREGFAQLLHLRVLAAGYRTQSLPTLEDHRHSSE